MAWIPAWVINLLIQAATTLGIPWLMKKFPGLPKQVWDLIDSVLAHIQGAPDKPAAVAEMRVAVNQVRAAAVVPQASPQVLPEKKD